jgi:hypothetical protein
MDVALGVGAVWITRSDGALERLNEATGAPGGSLKTDLGSTTVIDVADGAVWVAGLSGTLERFAPN